MDAACLIRRQAGDALLVCCHQFDQRAAFFCILNVLFGADLIGVCRLEDSAAGEGQIIALFIPRAATGCQTKTNNERNEPGLHKRTLDTRITLFLSRTPEVNVG